MTSPIAEIVQDENEGSRFVVLFCQISRFRFSTRLITHAHARRRAPAHPERRASWCPSAAKPINLLRLAPFRGGANPTPFQSRSLIQSYHRAQTHPPRVPAAPAPTRTRRCLTRTVSGANSLATAAGLPSARVDARAQDRRSPNACSFSQGRLSGCG